MSSIHLAESDADITRCFPVMHELRTHLVPGEFLERAAAHRFYFRQRLGISSFHFQRDLRAGGD